MTPKHRAHAGLAILAGIVMACSPPLAALPTPGAVTREPGTATIPAPTIAPATPTPVAPPATATPEPTATATLVPFTEHLAGAAVGLGGQFRPDMASLTSVRLADNNIRRQFNEQGIAPVMDAAGQAGVEICYYDGQCAVSLAAPNVFDGLRLDPQSPNTNEMLAAYVDPATGQEAGYLVRRVVYEDAVDGVGAGANAEAGAKRDYVWGVQENAAGRPVMVLVKVEDGRVRVVRPADAFFPAVPNYPPEYDQGAETLKINGQTIVRGVRAEEEPDLVHIPQELVDNMLAVMKVGEWVEPNPRFGGMNVYFLPLGVVRNVEIRTPDGTVVGIAAWAERGVFVDNKGSVRVMLFASTWEIYAEGGGGLSLRGEEIDLGFADRSEAILNQRLKEGRARLVNARVRVSEEDFRQALREMRRQNPAAKPTPQEVQEFMRRYYGAWAEEWESLKKGDGAGKMEVIVGVSAGTTSFEVRVP